MSTLARMSCSRGHLGSEPLRAPDREFICAVCSQPARERGSLVSLARRGSLLAVCHTCFCVEEAVRLLRGRETRALQAERPFELVWVEHCAQELYRAARAGRGAGRGAAETRSR